ncbi:MAG: hypothetical protein ACRD96_02535 [Bryobacteraceae bacterium]
MLHLALLAVLLQAPAFRQEKLHGRHAYVLENDRIRVSALRGGGHIAEIRFRDGSNPMRVPHYPTIEPYEYKPETHDALYGSGPHRWLSSGYMGHLLCFPAFGPPSSDDEVRAGLGNHGEAPIVEWRLLKTEIAPDAATLWYAADLPKTRFRVERTLRLEAGESVLRVEETVENLEPFDRPINWVQHATFGPPFAEPGKTFLDASATKGQIGGGRPGQNSLLAGREFDWPTGVAAGGASVSLRPFQPAASAGTYYALLMDPAQVTSWFTLYHADQRLLIGYLYPTADHPWLGDWQENRSNLTAPWDGKAIARGLEFGTTPFPEGLRKSVERGALYGSPTYRWIGGRQRLTTRFTVFLSEIPRDFAGVAGVAANAGWIVVSEQGSARTVRVRARLEP